MTTIGTLAGLRAGTHSVGYCDPRDRDARSTARKLQIERAVVYGHHCAITKTDFCYLTGQIFGCLGCGGLAGSRLLKH